MIDGIEEVGLCECLRLLLLGRVMVTRVHLEVTMPLSVGATALIEELRPVARLGGQ